MVRVDGIPYAFAGLPAGQIAPPGSDHGGSPVRPPMRALGQTLLETTPTRSRFRLEGGGILLIAEFLSPVEPGNLRAQSIPMSYLLLSAASMDGRAHDVQVYIDISGGWASSADSAAVSWAPERVSSPDGDLKVWTVYPSQPRSLAEENDMAAWGTLIWATPRVPGLTSQSGSAMAVRSGFASHGRLTNGNDARLSATSDDWPVFGFAVDLGQVAATVTVPLMLGQVRTPAIRYLGQNLEPLWSSYFRTWQDMLAFFWADASAASRRADMLDSQITGDATAAGGTAYAGLCALALRQAYGGTELVAGPGGRPWAFLKEISSDGNVSTVDVIYPASPVWLYADPAYLAMLLEPLLAYAEAGGWPKPYAEHDLGSAYPDAAGHNDGIEEDMPVEESGNMLIMAAACLQRQPATSSGLALAHYPVLKRWADYLASALPDPGDQNQTDDFAGNIAHSVNLALKGIIGIAAMGQIAGAAGQPADSSRYSGLARQYMSFWLQHAGDPDGQHLDLTYSGSGGGDGTWGTVYNGYADQLLGTGLVPAAIRAEQAAWYASQLQPFGLPLQVPHSYAKTDWEMFTAAWLSDYPIKDDLIRLVYRYAHTTPSRVPFSDLYSTVNGQQVAFQARPVQGGIFALLALQPAASTAAHLKARHVPG